jgi:hypothetical protein
MSDTLKIEVALDDVSGGIDQTVDLEQGIDLLRARLSAKYEQAVWPDGRPKAATPTEREQQEELINLQYILDSSTDRSALKRMERLREAHRVCAEWGVLIVHPPEGWADLANRPLRKGFAEAIVEVYTTAKYAEHVARGK